MKKYINNLLVLLLLLLMSLMLFNGCKKTNVNTDESKNQPIIESPKEEEKTTTADSTEIDTKKDDTKEADKDAQTLPDTKEVLIYGIQSETLESEQVSVSVPKESELTAEFIVNQVVDVFAENSLEIGIDSVTSEGDKVIVSFKADKAPLINVGSGVEVTILDSISMSLLDNLDTCKNVIFRTEGKAYASGHIELGIDEIYKWK